MARVSPNNITSLSMPWSSDPANNLPFSGAAVEKFIKDYLGSIARASYFESATNTMYWFASEDDKNAFIGDTSLTQLVLFSTTMSFASDLFRIALTNNVGTTTLNVATNETVVGLSVDFDVQTKAMTESAWRSTGKGVYVSVQVDAGAYGEYVTILEPTFYSAESTFTFNVRDYIIAGANRVRVSFVAEDDETIVSSITYTITMTEMFIEPLNNEWYIPIVETGDVANYKLGGFRIIGAINKTLNIDVYNGTYKLLHFEKSIGTSAYDRVPYYYTQDLGLDLSSLQSGVYLISAYLTSGTLTSVPVNYNIIYIAEGDETTAMFVAINDESDVVFNYTTSTLFKYCLYNKGLLSASPHVKVKQIAGTTPTTIVDADISEVATSTQHSYEVAIEWLTEETLNLYVQGEITFGNEQIARARLDNSATFPPTYGFEFYLNAASRANSDLDKEDIINAVNGQHLTPVWENLVWVDRVDGWTMDDMGRQCLYLPARSYLTLPFEQYKILNNDGITVELCYKVSNVTDYDEIVLSIMDNLESAGFTGIRIKPTNITVHSSADTSAVNDLNRGTNLMDERVVHFVLTIYPNFMGNTGRNVVTGYIDGCKNFQFDYSTGAIWNTNADFKVGSQRSDISLYFVRVYRSVLSDAAVQANYINSLKDIASRTELSVLLKSCMDASQSFINFENVKNNDYNYFVIEMLNGASLPSRANGWDKTQKGLSNLEMHFGKHPDWDWRIENVETAGQGTTSMNYYRWNLRWRIDKTSGKKVSTQYLESRTVHTGSYVYNWEEASMQGSIRFDGNNHPKLKRMTAKINFASSMQSHKIGATKAYTELHDEIDLRNEAQEYADSNNLARPTVAVYEYPAFGFLKVGDTYEFVGLFTIGPDKGDKPTFGYDISDDIKGSLLTMEGTDHSRKMVMFNYPWNSDVQYLYSNECLNIVKGIDDYDNGWEISNCHGLSTDDSQDQAAINVIIEDEFKPAYDIAYENSTLIIGIPLGLYGATAEDTLSYINSNIAVFQSQLDSNNRMTYANYQFWIEGEYDVYYYDIKDSIYKKNGQNLITQCGMPTGATTVAEENELFKARRRELFMEGAEDYWDIPDTLFHFDFLLIFGAMDNFGKNTYPYKMATLADGGRWKWRQDDLDSILGIGNAGADNMPDWMEFADSQDGSVYFGGSTSVFWNLIYECYYDNYVSTIDGATHVGLIGMGKQIMEAMSSLAGGTNTYDGVKKYVKRCFWDNAQEYFPQSAYNADAAYKYEAAWLANGQEVAPLTQSLGNHYSAEENWTVLRMIYMMSLFKAGAFGSYADTSLGQIAFRPQSLQSLVVKPYTELYPAFASGQGMVSTGRTKAGEAHVFVGPFGTDGQTSHYINASNMLVDLGDLKDLRLGAQYVNPLQVQGKKLIKFKIGDEEALIIITPAVYYTQAECNTANALLDGALSAGAVLTAEQVTLVNEALGTSYAEGDPISMDDANAYNATLEGAITVNDIKTPAVTTPNVTTNVPSLLFDNTYCIEEIDARNAQSLTGVVDLSACRRLKEAYFDGTSLTGVLLRNGSKVEKLHLAETTTLIILKNLRKLASEDFVFSGTLGNITSVLVQGCLLDAMQVIYDAYLEDNSKLTYMRIVQETAKQVLGTDYLEFLVHLRQGLDKDGNPTLDGYHGMSVDGAPLVTENPIFDATVQLLSGWKQSMFDIIGLTNIEDYGEGLKRGVASWFGALRVVFDPSWQFIEFADAEVNRILVNKWGVDGGVTMGKAASITGSWEQNIFMNNTTIVTFDEFQYFNHISTLSSSGMNTGGFRGCTSLRSLIFPASLTNVAGYSFQLCSSLQNVVMPAVTSIGERAFERCTSLQNITLPSTLTTIGNRAFLNCSSLKKIIIPSSVTSLGNQLLDSCSALEYIEFFRSITPYHLGNNSGYTPIIGKANCVVIVHGNITGTGGYSNVGGNFRCDKLVIYGSLNLADNYGLFTTGSSSCTSQRTYVGGSVKVSVNNILKSCKFTEVMGSVTSTNSKTGLSSASNQVCHFNAIPGTPTLVGISKIDKVYVGPGESRAGDEAVLATYLADTDWSAQSSKLGTWYDYNGTYKWYRFTFENCDTDNPVAWPHIMRGDSYTGVITPGEGYTLSDIKVYMYEAELNGVTPDTPTDITAQVFNATTGELNIESVIGNVLVTTN